MNMSPKYRWVPPALTAGAIYLLVGIGFPNPSSPSGAQFLWRLAAWGFSAIAFLGHILYEQFHLQNISRTIAFHVSLGVALGAFALSVAANIHGLRTETVNHRLLALSLILWPVITALPAFLVSFACSSILARIRANRKSPVSR
jgi:hypothetical protein